MKRALIAAVATLSLAACATPTVYAPSASPRTSGFSDYRIETGRYRVTYTGGNGAPMNQVADYALLRAAEVAVRDGYDWFRVVDRRDQRIGGGYGNSGPRLNLGVGSGGGGWRRGGGVRVGVGTSFDLSGGPVLSRTLEVIAGKGERPKDRDVYDARDIIRVIGQGQGR
jgi:hypothetical protein